MTHLSLVLATDETGKNITIQEVTNWLQNKSKKELSSFIYDRLYGRYLKPFNFPNADYKKDYKNGFSLMANCCLLIETYVSFIHPAFTSTNGRSEKAFGYFFTTDQRFTEFAHGCQSTAHYAGNDILIKSGVPNDFYSNVRCGILHNGETQNGWTITRLPKKQLFNRTEKEINAVKFAASLDKTLKEYKTKLLAADFDSDLIWQAFIKRTTSLMQKA